MPITWRNIDAPDLGGASRMLDSAQRSFSGMFGSLTDVIKNAETVDAANAVARTNNNTNSYLDQLQALGQSPEALQEAMKNGAVAKLRAGFGNEIDANRVRGAADALLAQRMQQATQANAFADAARDRIEAPIMDQIASLTAQGKRAEALSLLNTHTLRNEAGLYRGIDERGQVEVERERGTTRFGFEVNDDKRKTQKLNDDLLTNAAQRAAAAESRSASIEARKFARENQALAREDRMIQVKSALRKELGDSYGAAIDSRIGLDSIQAALKNLPEGARPLAREALREYQKTKGATLGGAVATIMATEEPEVFNLDSGIRKRALEAGIAAGTSEAAIARQQQEEIRRDLILKELSRLEGNKANNTPTIVADNPFGMAAPIIQQPAPQVVAPVVNKPTPVINNVPAIAQQMQKELREFNTGRLDFSPEVKEYRKKLEAAAKKQEKSSKELLAEELKRELKKSRNL